MLLADLVATSGAVASTRARSTKIAALAELLRRLAPDEVEAAVGFLTGEARQGRIGVGWATVFRLEVAPAADPTLTIADISIGSPFITAAVAGFAPDASRFPKLSAYLARLADTPLFAKRQQKQDAEMAAMRR